MAKEKEELKTKKVKEKLILKTGDCIVRKDSIFLKIVGVVNSGLGNMYAYVNCKSGNINWYSQYEIDEGKWEIKEPDFEFYRKHIKAGDIFKVADQDASPYITVLARVDNAVLLSALPQKGALNTLRTFEKAMHMMAEQSGEEMEPMLDAEDEADLRRRSSQLHSSKIADEWMDINKLCLMHWTLISDEG